MIKANAKGILLILLTVACAKLPPKPILTQNQVANDRKPISKPKTTSSLKGGEVIAINSFHRWAPVVDVRTYGKLVGKAIGNDFGRQAYNPNLFDEVPNSTWFTNRNARRPLSLEKVEQGATRKRLAATGPLKVIAGKSEGVTPGFLVKDKNNILFLLKFDSGEYCGLASGADVIGSRLYFAAGYNVPENNVEFIDVERFQKDPKATIKNPYGEKVPLSNEKYQDLLAKARVCFRGKEIRAMASRFLPGKPVGPFSYFGRRRDDPNDRLAHQHRRELRGLAVMAAWLNHTDWRNYNTLDMFQKTSQDKGYLVHYLIDFGSTLGSGSALPKGNHASQLYFVDYQDITMNLLALGFRDYDWLQSTPIKYRSIGNYRVEYFNPAKWKPTNPNPAQLAMTKRDGFWGAKLVASFIDDQLRAAVRAAKLPEPGAINEMVRILGSRRNLVAQYWFSKVGSLDQFTINGTTPQFSFKDWQNQKPWGGMHSVRYSWVLKGASKRISGSSTERQISPFSSAKEWEMWKKALRKRKRPYVKLRITPKVEVQEGLPFGKPVIKQEPISPFTEAIFYLDKNEKLHWVGVKRKT